MINQVGLPFLKEAEAFARATNEQYEHEWIFMCARCGNKKPHMDMTEEENYLWNRVISMPIGTHCICGACALHFLKWETAINDCLDLITCANYIRRAVSCRKNYLLTQQKSKLQVSLERCLSTRQKEF